MSDLNRKLLDLFQLSDGLLLPDEAVIEEISRKQEELRTWNEDIVFQGLITMREFLQELAKQNEAGLVNPMDQMDWNLTEKFQNGLSERNLNLPSVWELTRHLSNWIMVFIPPVRALDLRGDMQLVSCLESTDYYVSTLAATMLGDEEFSYIGSMEKFSEILNSTRRTVLRLEIGRLIYTRYDDPQALKKEMVPNLIPNENQFITILESDIQQKSFLSYVQEVVVWDIATQGKGPQSKWAEWWT